MEKYKIPSLTAQTPQADQTRLVCAMRNVRGVERAFLHAETGEIEIGVKDSHSPKREAIADAASSVGFPLAP